MKGSSLTGTPGTAPYMKVSHRGFHHMAPASRPVLPFPLTQCPPLLRERDTKAWFHSEPLLSRTDPVSPVQGDWIVYGNQHSYFPIRFPSWTYHLRHASSSGTHPLGELVENKQEPGWCSRAVQLILASPGPFRLSSTMGHTGTLPKQPRCKNKNQKYAYGYKIPLVWVTAGGTRKGSWKQV